MIGPGRKRQRRKPTFLPASDDQRSSGDSARSVNGRDGYRTNCLPLMVKGQSAHLDGVHSTAEGWALEAGFPR